MTFMTIKTHESYRRTVRKTEGVETLTMASLSGMSLIATILLCFRSSASFISITLPWQLIINKMQTLTNFKTSKSTCAQIQEEY